MTHTDLSFTLGTELEPGPGRHGRTGIRSTKRGDSQPYPNAADRTHG